MVRGYIDMSKTAERRGTELDDEWKETPVRALVNTTQRV